MTRSRSYIPFKMAGWIKADHKDLMRRYNELAADKRYEGMRRR